jgi:F1F0 ATPase subunit 2
MSEIYYEILALISGIVLGIFFFAGLWFTVKNFVNHEVSTLWFAASFLFRIGFYFMAIHSLPCLLFSAMGFISARYIILPLANTNRIRNNSTYLHRER